MRQPRVTILRQRFDRLRRHLGFDRNPLRRPVDHRQRTAGLVLAGLFLTVGPVAAMLGAGPVYEAGIRAERHQAATRHQVMATVLEVEEPRLKGTDVRLGWTGPDGVSRTGGSTWSGTPKAGEKQRVWVGTSGSLSERPRVRSQTVGDAVFAGGVAAGAVGAVLLLVYWALRRSCDQHRSLAWDAAWARFDVRHTR